MTMMFAERLRRLKQQLTAADVDFLALVPGPNLIYFTGLRMHLSERPIVALLPANDAPPILIAPAFEVGKASTELAWRTYSYADGTPYQAAFEAAADACDLHGKAIAVEPLGMRMIEWTLLSQSVRQLKHVFATELIAPLRMVKDETEVAKIRQAIALAESAFTRTLGHIRAGMTEREVAGVLMGHLLSAGAQSLLFEPLVQAGPNAANPHAHAGDRPLQRGDLVVIDFGAVVDGYGSDITRTIAIGEPDAEMRAVYEVVKAANAAGRAAARPGATGEAVDRAARAVIESAGYGPSFTHRTGHGLGLEGHEPPYMVRGETTVLQPGMTFTVEPGIYLAGKGGVRIEDDVLITADGSETLTTLTRDLIIL